MQRFAITSGIGHRTTIESWRLRQLPSGKTPIPNCAVGFDLDVILRLE